MSRRTWSLAGVALGALCVPHAVVAQGYPSDSTCINCHLDQEDERLLNPALLIQTDVHRTAGFGCLACHGGDRPGRISPAESGGFLSKPTRAEIPELCGSCHSDAQFMRGFNPTLRVDQELEYASSVHGQKLREEADTSVATCVSCHPAHDTRPPSDPESSVHPANVATTCANCHADSTRMAGRDLPTDQFDEYVTGVHGQLMIEEGDLTAPTCNDCHGNHGAAPPEVTSVSKVCGQCHAMMEDFFVGGGHDEYFDDEELPGCATCHGNHAIEEVSDDLLRIRGEEVCTQCHENGDGQVGAFLDMKNLVDSLKAEQERSRLILEDATNLGMEVSQAVFELESVNNALTKARTAIHGFAVEAVAAEVDEGFTVTTGAFERGEEALAEHRFRRVGLGASALVIALLIVGLSLKIRALEEGDSHA